MLLVGNSNPSRFNYPLLTVQGIRIWITVEGIWIWNSSAIRLNFSHFSIAVALNVQANNIHDLPFQEIGIWNISYILMMICTGHRKEIDAVLMDSGLFVMALIRVWFQLATVQPRNRSFYLTKPWIALTCVHRGSTGRRSDACHKASYSADTSWLVPSLAFHVAPWIVQISRKFKRKAASPDQILLKYGEIEYLFSDPDLLAEQVCSAISGIYR